MTGAALGLLLLATSSSATLEFIGEAKAPVHLTKGQLEKLGTEIVAGYDPYYRKPKKFRAVRIDRIFAKAFPGVDLANQEFMLKANDGYAIFMSGTRLLEKGGFIAVADLEVPTWEPIGSKRDHPGPFYLVWREKHQQDLEHYPRPWQLATIEIATVEAKYPHAKPQGIDDTATAMTGYQVFRTQCIQCHAINREGGRIGPDLNVPQSIVEYRPEAQIRQYIVNPLSFRYGAMPAHPGLTAVELDGLISYFHEMKKQKNDPEAAQP